MAQIAVLGATAYAAKDLHPGDFALYGTVSGGSWLAVSFNTLSAEWRAPVVDDDRADSLLRAGGCFTVMVSLAAVLAGVVSLFVNKNAASALWFIAVCSFFLGMQQLLTAIIMRTQRQFLLARGRLVQGLGNAAMIVCLLQTPLSGFLVLAGSWTLSLGAGVLTLYLGCHAEVPKVRLPARAEWTALLSEVRFQPIATMMATSVGSMPLLLLPAIAGNSLSGAWALTDRFLNPLVNTAYNTLQPIYYARAAEQIRNGQPIQFRHFHSKWVITLVAGGLPMVVFNSLVILVILPLFGDQWRIGSQVVVPACLYYVSLFVCCPLQQTLLLLGDVRTQFRWTIVRCATCVGSLALAPAVGPRTSLLLWSICAAGTFYAHIFLQRRSARRFERNGGAPAAPA